MHHNTGATRRHPEDAHADRIAGISTGLLPAVLALIIGDRLVGLRRLADF